MTAEFVQSERPSPEGARQGELRLGDLLLAKGLLSQEDIDRIIGEQERSGATFGQAALRLGLVDRADLEAALAEQFSYPLVPTEGTGVFSEELVVAASPFSDCAEAIRAVRSQFVLRCLDNGRRAVAVLGPSAGCGATFLASNLAISLAQIGARTLLVDGDMRSGRIHTLFGIARRRGGLSDALVGRLTPELSIIHDILPGLSILPAGTLAPNPQELLSGNKFLALVNHLLRQYDAAVFDTPPANESADSQAISARIDASIIVARANRTHYRDVQVLADMINRNGEHLVGTVLNDF